MENKIKRPKFVLIAQLILLCFLLVLFVIPIKMSMNLRDEIGYSEGFSPSMAWPAIFGLLFRYFLVLSPVLILFLASSIGLAMRRQVGRWLGVFSLLLILVFLISHVLGGSELFPLLLGTGTYMNLAVIVQISLALLIVAVISQLVFAASVKSFFERKVRAAVGDPPSPPSFDA